MPGSTQTVYAGSPETREGQNENGTSRRVVTGQHVAYVEDTSVVLT
nr:MAG TPA: hypothetical protein [Caudoviricetes sp.]